MMLRQLQECPDPVTHDLSFAGRSKAARPVPDKAPQGHIVSRVARQRTRRVRWNYGERLNGL